MAISLWNDKVEQYNVQVTKVCESLCFENIVRLYAIMRGFSFARGIVNKYKLSEQTVEFMETVKGWQWTIIDNFGLKANLLIYSYKSVPFIFYLHKNNKMQNVWVRSL